MMPAWNSDKRRVQRQRKRFQVRFDAKGIVGTGFTGNLSPSGLRIDSRVTSAPGSIVRGQILLSGNAPMDFQAQVRWVHKASGPLVHMFQSAMGLKFIAPPSENYFQLLLETSTAA
jgi:PilZ domain